MKLKKILSAALLVAAITFMVSSCKSGEKKDAELKAAIEKKLKESPDMATTVVDVKDGVATISGVCKDDACKAMCEKTATDEGAKKVVNNCTVAPPVTPPTSTIASQADPKLQDAVKAIIKDIPGITISGFSDKGVALAGDISKANNMKLKQALAAAKIMLDAAASKLTVK